MDTKNFATLTSEQAQEIDGGSIRLITTGPTLLPYLALYIIGKIFF